MPQSEEEVLQLTWHSCAFINCGHDSTVQRVSSVHWSNLNRTEQQEDFLFELVDSFYSAVIVSHEKVWKFLASSTGKARTICLIGNCGNLSSKRNYHFSNSNFRPAPSTETSNFLIKFFFGARWIFCIFVCLLIFFFVGGSAQQCRLTLRRVWALHC